MLSALARFLLRIRGWTIVGGLPEVPKAVLIAAPHTSNWDGFVALTYKVAIGLDVKFFGKESLFWFPLGTLLRALGGIPLDRSHAGSAVGQAVRQFNENDSFYLGLAPEGTRSKRPHWKTGFYRIAQQAGVPVIPGYMDYPNKRIGLGDPVYLSGDTEKDLDIFRDFYAGIEGSRPEKTSPIRFAS
jgi:1-acyl-sn-glycerol-3-phosphate acyltransferase